MAVTAFTGGGVRRSEGGRVQTPTGRLLVGYNVRFGSKGREHTSISIAKPELWSSSGEPSFGSRKPRAGEGLISSEEEIDSGAMERNNETNSDRRRSRTCFLEAEEAHRHGAAEQQGNSFANCDRSKRVCREEVRDRGRERDENWKRGRDREGRERERERSRSRSRMREDESGANYRQREEGGYESAGEREEKRRRQQRETERDAREPQQQHFYREKARGEKPWSRDMEGRGSNSNSSSSDRDQRHVLLKSRQDQRELDRDRSRYHREKDRDRERERERERERDGKEVVKKCAENGGEKSGEERARTYQLEVLAQAKVKNTIAFLETGAGKTLIAVLLMKYKHQLMREQEPNHKRMLAVFLVPKVPLVYQVCYAMMLYIYKCIYVYILHHHHHHDALPSSVSTS